MSRRGLAVPAALVLVSVFLVFVAGLMKFSGQETGNVRTLIDLKQAEYLAYSGLNMATVRLHGGRWWVAGMKFDPTNKVPRPTGGTMVAEPFGAGKGKAYIIAEEFESANPTPIPGYSKVQRLDHIRVLSIGEVNGSRVLVFGKYIMSPEPLLNSDSTEAAETQAANVTSNGDVEVRVPKPWSQDGPVPAAMVVKAVHVTAGQKVDPNTVLALLAPHPDDPVQITMTWEIKAPAFGTLKTVSLAVGQKVFANDLFGVCTDELMTAVRSNKTLKKMVRITKIADRTLANLDLSDFHLRRNRVDALIRDLSRAYVLNYGKNLQVSPLLEKSFASPLLPARTTESDVLARLKDVPLAPTLDFEHSGNRFMEDMMQKWVMPGLAQDIRRAFPGASEYHLGVRRSDPRPEIMEVLAHFGRLGDIETAPRRNPGLYQIKGTDRFLQIKKPDLGADQAGFIKDATFLPDGAKKIRIVFDKGTPLEDQPFKDAVAAGQINPDDYWWWESKQGWYTKPDISIEPVDIPYNYVNNSTGSPFTMELGFVLTWLRKHYDEGLAVPPRDTIRAPSDQNDTPQAPGPPDSTGCAYSGVSS